MSRALELASLGRETVSPNPMVGCVIVHDDKIVGEGWHRKYGEAHAEVNAIADVDNDDILSNSTVYVTLEPCAHHGKTPPCADLLVAKRVKRVVIAAQDPFDQVDGKGIDRMLDAGIEVEVGLLENEAHALNERFFTFHLKKRPFIILKWAQTADGFIARENHDSKWISSSYSRQLVHKWRSEEAAILVGKNTAMHDDPTLTTREWEGKNPIRVLLDSNLEVSTSSNLFNTDAPTIILNTVKQEKKEHLEWVKVDMNNPLSVLNRLYEKKIQSVIIEGGAQVLNSFIQENCWDEARVFTSEKIFERGIAAPLIEGRCYESSTFEKDTLTIYKNQNG